MSTKRSAKVLLTIMLWVSDWQPEQATIVVREPVMAIVR